MFVERISREMPRWSSLSGILSALSPGTEQRQAFTQSSVFTTLYVAGSVKVGSLGSVTS